MKARLISLDTIRVYLRRAPSEDELRYMEEHCGSMADWKPMPHQCSFWPAGGCIHQPTYEVLRFIKDEFPGHLLSRVDPALDLIAGSAGDAEAINAYLSRHLVQKWHKGRVTRIEDTTYSRGAGPGVAVARYADRPSKANGLPCVHIEWRLQGAAAVRGGGFSSIDDIFGFDAREFWRKRIRLRSLPQTDHQQATLALLLQGLHGRTATAAIDRLDSPGRGRLVRAGWQLLRASVAASFDQPTAQETIDFLGPRISRYGGRAREALNGCFLEIDSEWMLPSP